MPIDDFLEPGQNLFDQEPLRELVERASKTDLGCLNSGQSVDLIFLAWRYMVRAKLQEATPDEILTNKNTKVLYNIIKEGTKHTLLPARRKSYGQAIRQKTDRYDGVADAIVDMAAEISPHGLVAEYLKTFIQGTTNSDPPPYNMDGNLKKIYLTRKGKPGDLIIDEPTPTYQKWFEEAPLRAQISLDLNRRTNELADRIVVKSLFPDLGGHTIVDARSYGRSNDKK